MIVRSATIDDASAVARILAEAFPSLYQAAFGKLNEVSIADLLTALYLAGTLSLEATRIAEREGEVIGLAILHIGRSIGRGSVREYWRTLRNQLGVLRGLRALLGGITANSMLNNRIPRAADLVYIEALAVRADARGRGIGTHLLRDAEEWARARQRPRLALHVLSTNTGARRLYERMGFRLWQHPPRTPLAALLSPRHSDWGALLLMKLVARDS